MSASTFNLAKNIMGAGSISLPGSIAAIGDVKGAIAPSVAILSVMGSLSAYTFSMIAKECARYNAKSFEDVWAATIGEKSKKIVTQCIVVTTLLACLAYSMIIGDLFSAILVTAGAEGVFAKRWFSIVGITATVVTPLCFLKSLAALSVTSLIGTFGVFYSTIVMGIRYFDQSYVEGGRFFADLPLKPSFGALRNAWNLDHMTFVMLSCLGTAFLAHFNAPAFYNDLQGKSMDRFNKVIRRGFGASTIVFAGMMAFGFGTFGSSTLGNVFVNYNKADVLATLCRFATFFSITFTYPLAFVGLKRGVFSLMEETAPTEKTNTLVTAGLITALTAAAVVLQDLGFVAALTGSLMGSLIIYVFPALFKLKSLQKIGNPLTLADKLSTYGLIGLGSILGVVGVAVSVLKQFTTILG